MTLRRFRGRGRCRGSCAAFHGGDAGGGAAAAGIDDKIALVGGDVYDQPQHGLRRLARKIFRPFGIIFLQQGGLPDVARTAGPDGFGSFQLLFVEHEFRRVLHAVQEAP